MTTTNLKRKKRYLGFEDQMLAYAQTQVKRLVKNDTIDDALFE